MKCAVPDRFDLCDPADGFPSICWPRRRVCARRLSQRRWRVRHGCRGSQATLPPSLPLSAACWWAVRRARKGAAFDLLRRG